MYLYGQGRVYVHLVGLEEQGKYLLQVEDKGHAGRGLGHAVGQGGRMVVQDLLAERRDVVQ